MESISSNYKLRIEVLKLNLKRWSAIFLKQNKNDAIPFILFTMKLYFIDLLPNFELNPDKHNLDLTLILSTQMVFNYFHFNKTRDDSNLRPRKC
jgi:hypothetical protein